MTLFGLIIASVFAHQLVVLPESVDHPPKGTVEGKVVYLDFGVSYKIIDETTLKDPMGRLVRVRPGVSELLRPSPRVRKFAPRRQAPKCTEDQSRRENTRFICESNFVHWGIVYDRRFKPQAAIPPEITQDQIARYGEKVFTLKAEFRKHVLHYMNWSRSNAVIARINSALRPPIRAWLMRHSWDLCEGNMDYSWVRMDEDMLPCDESLSDEAYCDALSENICSRVLSKYADLDLHPGIRAICSSQLNGKRLANQLWDMGSEAATKKTACEIKETFDLVANASLNSNHFKGEAVDLSLRGRQGLINSCLGQAMAQVSEMRRIARECFSMNQNDWIRENDPVHFSVSGG